MDKNKAIIYQINLHMFTPQGTLRAAKELLPHIRSIGANVVYLFSICQADDSKDRKFWSERQKKSKLNNPKNPYRIYDYFTVDENFGGNEQLREFIDGAHKLGLKVMLDLVYFHCSPNAKIIQDVPDSVLRDESGKPVLGRWNFPCLNFQSRALREYLIENMRYYIREYGVDGYRCDVADLVPLDFWKEAVDEIRKLKPDVLMLNEGRNPEYVLSGVFDYNYGRYNRPNTFYVANDIAASLKASRDKMAAIGIKGNRGVLYLENHDTVNDSSRVDNELSPKVSDCLYTYIFTVDAIPFLYCGEEIGDKNEHNMFATKTHNRGYGIDWSNALLPHGKRRLALIKRISALRKTEAALIYGDFSWLETEKDVLGFERSYGNEKISVYINFGKKAANIPCFGKALLTRGYQKGKLRANGFAVYKEER